VVARLEALGFINERQRGAWHVVFLTHVMRGDLGMESVDVLHWQLGAISPLDGRYQTQLGGLGDLVSESGLIGYRLYVEAQWLLHLASEPVLKPFLKMPDHVAQALKEITPPPLDPTAAARIKGIERTTNHDVKAVEYYLRDYLTQVSASPETLSFIHFACTSEDINNLSYALMLKDVRERRLLPVCDQLLRAVAAKVSAHAALPMLSRTHGQTASPTTLGKELAVFGRRLLRQRRALSALPIEGKINGAVGNYNAHVVAFPDVDWPEVARSFVKRRLGLAFNPLTTQIENHDSLVEFASTLSHFNTVLIGFARDIWAYISIGYFRQEALPGEVGSSTMPHKVNPIDFENAEGNLGVANALARHFADKLLISRWQRDLSDSTVLRTLGTLVGHSELAWRSFCRGLEKIAVDPVRLAADLDQAWEVLAEPVQTVMRRYGVVDAYERLKAATRGRPTVTREVLHALVDECTLMPSAAKAQLKALTPSQYVGLGERLARDFLGELARDLDGGKHV
jgi:adenylosuccinate lyase